MSGFKNLIVNSQKYSFVVNMLRAFFLEKGFIEVHTQNRLSILAACEDPTTISTFKYAGSVFPLPQTGQMWLEWEMLKYPKPPGYFCVSTSYRNEKNPVPGRHELVFPMFEFEQHGGFAELKEMEIHLLNYLGYRTGNLHSNDKRIKKYNLNNEKNPYFYGDYKDIAKMFKTEDISHKHEMELYNTLKIKNTHMPASSIFFLQNFPEYTSPFWNMRRNPRLGTANKVDIIMSGMETIGSAEREVDVDVMRKRFTTISNGEYASLLYKLFGKKRVDAELDEFLSLKFFPRSGGGIGITRLIRSMEIEGLIS
jgi:aspartyl/asparaginyl-tRNA synthetase